MGDEPVQEVRGYGTGRPDLLALDAGGEDQK